MRMVCSLVLTIVELVECRLVTTGQGVRTPCAKQIAISFTIVELRTSMVTVIASIACVNLRVRNVFNRTSSNVSTNIIMREIYLNTVFKKPKNKPDHH